MKTKVFISYKKVKPSQEVARFLTEQLGVKGYDPFIDVMQLRGGAIWAQEIYKHIGQSDVLLVLLQKETAGSEWVQREVDVARGARVSILPVRITEHETDIDVKEVQEKLAISETQFLPFDKDNPDDFGPLLESIEILSKQTRQHQRTWINELNEKWRARAQAACKESYAVYHLPDAVSNCKIHLATGDIAEMEHIEAIVNSENDYMQMARIHESYTLSSVLRREGSQVTVGGIQDDTVQRELDEQIKNGVGFRPIQLGQVIATNAGHPESSLVQNGARYIFHVAVVMVNPLLREHMTPLGTDTAIKKAVLNCLNKVQEVDLMEGMISPKGTTTAEREERAAENYRPIKSIIFPLFGTGHGGRSVPEVAPPMIRAFKKFLEDNPKLKLENIHLGVFANSDIRFVEEAFVNEGFVRA